jgi:signal transduction histidine kinase
VNSHRKTLREIRKNYLLLLLIWSFMLGWLFWLSWQQQTRIMLKFAENDARVNINKDLAFRRWATSHGGVYVTPTGHTPPNPYLNVPLRDVVTMTGQKLTLMNPAYMLRELQNDFPGSDGSLNHITSLKPYNPNNAPDAWETDALQSFDKGYKERLSVQQKAGISYIRLMQPMYVEQGCLKCHGHQGYKVGDIRGGISTTVPLTPYLMRGRELNIDLLPSRVAIWLAGLIGLFFSYRRVIKDAIARERVADELIASEQKYHLVADYTSDWEFWTGVAGEIIYMSPSCVELTGYQASEFEANPALMSSIIHPEDRVLYESHMHSRGKHSNDHGKNATTDVETRHDPSLPCRAIVHKAQSKLCETPCSPPVPPLPFCVPRTGRPIGEGYGSSLRERHVDAAELQFRITTKTGKTRWISHHYRPVFDSAGNWRGIRAGNRDITDLKQSLLELSELKGELEARVAERTQQLEAANRELEAFSYSVSHDLRSPLRAIDGFSHILLEDYAGVLDEEGQRLLKVVRDNTVRMGQLIDDILQFSRTGRFEMKMEDIDMNDLSREALAELNPDSDTQIEIEAMPHVTADRPMLRQVWINLLSNAIKFSSGKKPATINVNAVIEGGEVVFCIKDNGAGFDMQYSDKLFGVFQRLHSVSEFDGTGIGLAIVKRIITRHGGRVWAEGQVGLGASFYFSLPNDQQGIK